jgi:PKD repeat protein
LGEVIIDASLDPAPSNEEVDARLRKEAAKIGADAVVVVHDRIQSVGTVYRTVYAVTARQLVGVAIKYTPPVLTMSAINSAAQAPSAAFRYGTYTAGSPYTVDFASSTDNTTAATVWNWSFGDGGTSTNQDPVHTYASAGPFAVRLIANNGSNYATNSTNIFIVAFSSSSNGGQSPVCVTFTDRTRGTVSSRSWCFGDTVTNCCDLCQTYQTTSPTISHTFTNPGIYAVTLIDVLSGNSSMASYTNFVLVSPGNTANWFTNTYGLVGSTNIVIAPATSVGIFYVGDTVTISNSLRTKIEIYDYHFNHVTNMTPPAKLKGLGLGHYFVQVDGTKGGLGDRSEFVVLPAGYTNSPHSDIGSLEPGNRYQRNRYVRLAPGMSRVQRWWYQPTNDHNCCDGITRSSSANHNYTTNNWFFFSTVLRSRTPIKVLNVVMGHGGVNEGYGIMAAPPVDQTNYVNDWVNDVAALYSNAAIRFGTNYVYEILNEPSASNILFTNTSYSPYWIDPYWSVQGGAYPASMAVSAAAQAVRFVCPNCQVWAPANLGVGGWVDAILTDSFVVANYSAANLNVLSFHNNNQATGPVDNNLMYTNRTDLGAGSPNNPLMSEDVSLQQVHSLYGKPFAVTEVYPQSPSALGKINSWYMINPYGGIAGGSGYWPDAQPQFGWDWRTMTTRFWKDVIIRRGSGVQSIEVFLGLSDFGTTNNWTPGDNSCYGGWDIYGNGTYDFIGCGPRPTTSGQCMLSWWLQGSAPITNWLSGTPVTRVQPNGVISNGCVPGLHFWAFRFANGTTNTFVWADEGYGFTTNLGVGLTDIWSNRWTGAITNEPLIAWSYPVGTTSGRTMGRSLVRPQPVADGD